MSYLEYLEQWHNPAFRLQACKDGIDRELTYAETENGWNGPAFVNTSCEHGYDSDCETCKAQDEFSASSCEICGSPLAGGRFAVALIEPGTERESLIYSACADCMYYVEYGQLDDMTMMEIDESGAIQ